LLVDATEQFFTRSLNIHTAAKLVDNSDAIFRTAITKDQESSEKDVGQYLHKVKERAAKFLQEEAICGRLDICTDIEDYMLDKGTLALITGGRSVGKSKLVTSVAQAIGRAQETTVDTESPQPRVAVVMVDGCCGRDLTRALRDVVADQQAASADKATLTGEVVALDVRVDNFDVSNIAEAIGLLARRRPPDTEHVVLILDDADMFFKRGGRDEAAELFNAIVLYTKQLNLMSVLLVSSDEGLLDYLHDLGVNTGHIAYTSLVNEPTPRECTDLLRDKLGVGGHLCSALLDCYGGHVYEMCAFLRKLPSAYTRGPIRICLGPATDISHAIGVWSAENDEVEILQVLEQLARTGFVPVSTNNKLARLLCKYKICKFLTEDTSEYQVPSEVRAQRAGLIPETHLLRVLIASELAEIEVSARELCEVKQLIQRGIT
jgi:energy-coupling factor transporter ATP-binding protein EcfA2